MKPIMAIIVLIFALAPGMLFANDTLEGDLFAPVQDVEPEGPTFTVLDGVTLISESITNTWYHIKISERPDRCYVITAQLADEILQATAVVNGVETMADVLNEDGTPMNMNQLASFGEVTFTPSDWGPKRMQVTGKWEDSKHIERFLELKVEHKMESRGWNDPLCDGAIIDELAVIPTTYDIFTVWDDDHPGIAIEKTDDAALTYGVRLTSQPLGRSVTVTPGMAVTGGTWGDAPPPLVFTQDNWDQYQTVTASLICGAGNATFSHVASGLGFDDVEASYMPAAQVVSFVDGIYIDNIQAIRHENEGGKDDIEYRYNINAVIKPAHDITINVSFYSKFTDDPDTAWEFTHFTETLSADHWELYVRVDMLMVDDKDLTPIRHTIDDLNGGSFCDHEDGDELEATVTFPSP